ncbi:hypothetical protein [Singulisphaera sp. PoT]|uniref:hypothetical protein n=1 Tax=Singulisphaera sp. PoT TaxID=3411797 RepID=UPI003BF59414
MAGTSIKFRCYQCNQLLGVSRNRVGGVVSCPKCQAGLIVPDPTEGAGPLDLRTEGESTGSGSTDGGIPLDLIDIRPEDIRVEPGAYRSPASPSSSEPQEAATSGGPGLQVAEPPASWEQPPAPPRPLRPSSASVEAPAPTFAPEPERTKSAEDLNLPQIDLAPARRSPTRHQPLARSRDVVISRTTLAMWSLFVLIAQVLAFLAGLLAGHFVWKVH